MLLILRFSSVESISKCRKDCLDVRALLGTFLRQSSAFPEINDAKSSGAVRLVLLPSLIAQIPAFSVMGQGRRSISLAVNFLSPAERHAGSEVCNALWLSPFQRAREFSWPRSTFCA